MGNGRQSRQNRKKDPARNRTLRQHKMQKNLPRHPKQKENLNRCHPQNIKFSSFFSLSSICFEGFHSFPKSLQRSYFLGLRLGIKKIRKEVKFYFFLFTALALFGIRFLWFFCVVLWLKNASFVREQPK